MPTAEADDGLRADAEAERCISTERTPLLLSSHQSENRGAADDNPPKWEETTVIVEDMSFARLALIMSAAWVGVFLSALDSTIIATLSAPISSEFHSLSLLSWLATAYLMSTAASQPISGRLTDIFGRGPGLVFSNLFFAVGNLICGLSTSRYTIILGRVVAGIGGGGLMSIPTFLGSDLVPLRNRGLVSGISNLWYSLGAMTGTLLGGFLNDYTGLGWRLAFFIQAPPALLSALVVLLMVKVPPKQSQKSYLARVDFLGVFLILSFLVLLVLGLNSGSVRVPWIRPLPCVSLSAAMFIAFIFWENKASQPIIPVKLLLDRTVLAACLTSLLSSMLAMTSIFYVPLYLQVLGNTPSKAGLKIFPSSVGISIGALGAGFIMRRTGRYTNLGVMSVLVLIAGIVLYTLQKESSPFWLTSVAVFIFGVGYNSACTVVQVACVAAADQSEQAVITSTMYLARSLGGTSGITLASAVFQGNLRSGLQRRFGSEPRAPEIIGRILDNLSEMRHLPAGWYEGVMEAYMAAFRGVWLTMLGWAALALMCISLIKQHKLHSSLDRR
ncbi:major facilitator superfamily protein [Hirsutella rhossiliensis]|uniref:Major facilitator superfamily domain-containing protein n=1 Tax=Hirsutella rhossiliensis TaxID=111463 RepID=A0A9P8MSF2_9HYPO|nr:major facilitator superfamily domain-containing protein [Hirsutella rhossiliensis]KAH0959609.1 major facilitator superfamily domain-containing protein [Hirsutella rhossiliensis]